MASIECLNDEKDRLEILAGKKSGDEKKSIQDSIDAIQKQLDKAKK